MNSSDHLEIRLAERDESLDLKLRVLTGLDFQVAEANGISVLHFTIDSVQDLLNRQHVYFGISDVRRQQEAAREALKKILKAHHYNPL